MYTVSVVIPAWHEEDTIGGLISHIQKESKNWAPLFKLKTIYLITHDKATGEVGKKADQQGNVKHYLVPRHKGGKIASLNKALSLVKKENPDITIFLDGDIVLSKNALLYLLKSLVKGTRNSPTSQKQHVIKYGAVTGRPAPLNPKNNLFGFWAHTLTNAAHKMRLYNARRNLPVNITGNIYAEWTHLLPNKLPLNILDDIYMSYYIQAQGYPITYSPKSIAKQYFPTTYKQWLTQKLRNLKNEKTTLTILLEKQKNGEFKHKPQNMRSFLKEVAHFTYTLELVKSPKQAMYLILLFLARLHVWILATLESSPLLNPKAYTSPWRNWVKIKPKTRE